MKKKNDTHVLFTVKEFAQFHHLNKRTLHYYDEIQLFSPKIKIANGYRYYSIEQSSELEYILALKELGMTITEMKDYLSNPRLDELLQITDSKLKEIDDKIQHLERLKGYLTDKQFNMRLIHEIEQDQIIVKEVEEEYIYCTELDTTDHKTNILMKHLRNAWKYHPFKVGCGSYIDIEKIKCRQFQHYDGLYSIIEQQPLQNDMRICERGTYLYAYHIGTWDELSSLYEKILDYAKQHHYRLSGYAYERGISELSLLHRSEYITEIKIKCEKMKE